MDTTCKITVVFQAAGEDQRVSQLDKLTLSKLYNQKKEFDADEGRIYFIELELSSEAADEERAIATAINWLNTNRSLLEGLNARLKLEIQTAIEPEHGSKGLSLPNDFLCLLADLGCDLLHQYSRVPSDEELKRVIQERPESS